MASDDSTRLLDLIGQTVISLNPKLDASVLLYAQLATNMVDDILLVDQVADVLGFFPEEDKLMSLLLDLWEEEPVERRWAEIEYLVRDGRFTATFTYPEEIDPEEDDFDRRMRIIRKHFGDKPLVYAPDERFDRMKDSEG